MQPLSHTAFAQMIRQTARSMGMGLIKLSQATGLPHDEIAGIYAGSVYVTPNAAARLSRGLNRDFKVAFMQYSLWRLLEAAAAIGKDDRAKLQRAEEKKAEQRDLSGLVAQIAAQNPGIPAVVLAQQIRELIHVSPGMALDIVQIARAQDLTLDGDYDAGRTNTGPQPD